jgi:ferritin-like metal-binding protein YciE
MAEHKTVQEWLMDEVNYQIDQQKGSVDALKDHADKTHDEDLKTHLMSFRADHELHRDRLQRFLDTLKGGRSMGLGEALGMSLGGSKAIMDGARDTDYSSLFRECIVENALIGAYETCLKFGGTFGTEMSELVGICRQNMEEDKRHLDYLQSHFRTVLSSFFGGTTGYRGEERYGTTIDETYPSQGYEDEEPPERRIA